MPYSLAPHSNRNKYQEIHGCYEPTVVISAPVPLPSSIGLEAAAIDPKSID